MRGLHSGCRDNSVCNVVRRGADTGQGWSTCTCIGRGAEPSHLEVRDSDQATQSPLLSACHYFSESAWQEMRFGSSMNF